MENNQLGIGERIALLVFGFLSALGGLACILQYLGIRPKDVRMPVGVPHVLWLLVGLALFVVSIGSSAWVNVAQKPRIKRLQGELAQERESTERLKGDTYENARLNLEYRDKLATFSVLQWEALSLSLRLLNFIESQGPPPQPKYSAEEVRRMPLDMDNKDLNFASEFHFGGNLAERGPQTEDQLYSQIMARFRLLDPWYEKITAGYNLEFRAEVERIHDRFAVEGIADESLKVPAQGRLARKEIRGIASKLWELAYKLRDKEVEIEEA